MLIEKIERLIREAPGLTATELAQKLFGDDGYHARVGAECRLLAYLQRVERRGAGGVADPYRYFPLNGHRAAGG